MFTTLLESKAARPRRHGASLVSVLVHAAVGAAFVALTAGAATRVDEPVEQQVQFVEPPPPTPPDRTLPPPDVAAAPPIAKGFQALTAPIEIPDVIPPIDLSRAETHVEDFSGKGVLGGRRDGVEGAPAPPLVDGAAYAEWQVEKPAVALPGGAAPAYPDLLRSAGVEGTVTVQFVIDTTGQAEPASITILSSPQELFAQAVRRALPRMRFLPAQIGERRVRQLVQQPFAFTLAR
jgi:protein TonB